MVPEQRLAGIYFDRVLHAREKNEWESVGKYANRLVMLAEQNKTGEDLWSPSGSSLYMAAWHRIHGMDCARNRVQFGFDMLSDTDPDNDVEAWDKLGEGLCIVDDWERAIAAYNMARQINLFGYNDKPNNEAGVDEGDGNDDAGTQTTGTEPQLDVQRRDSKQRADEKPITGTLTDEGRSGLADQDESSELRIDVRQGTAESESKTPGKTDLTNGIPAEDTEVKQSKVRNQMQQKTNGCMAVMDHASGGFLIDKQCGPAAIAICVSAKHATKSFWQARTRNGMFAAVFTTMPNSRRDYEVCFWYADCWWQRSIISIFTESVERGVEAQVIGGHVMERIRVELIYNGSWKDVACDLEREITESFV